MNSSTSSSNGRHRQALAILGVAFLLLGGWRGLLAWLDRRAEFGESNYQANRIRIERYLRRTRAPAWAILGSSFTGRLRPGAFDGTAMQDVAVLGLDGSTPLLGLAVLTNRGELPRHILVETYSFNRGWRANDQLLFDGLHDPGLKLAMADRMFAADERPSSLLYSALKERRDPSTASAGPRTNAGLRLPGPAEHSAAPNPADFARLRSAVAEIRDRGVEVILLDMLAGEKQMPGPRDRRDTAGLLADELGLRRIDLRAAWFQRGWVPVYTDGRHLDAASADAAAKLLAELAAPN